MNIDTSQTPEKFQSQAGAVIDFLLEQLKALDQLEQEIHDRYELLTSQREVANQTHPDEEGLWEEYAERSTAIISPISTKPYTDNSRSFGQPTKYAYLAYPDTRILFLMKSANRAVVEMQYEYGITRKEQFVLKLENNTWKIDAKKYGYPDEDSWYKDDL